MPPDDQKTIDWQSDPDFHALPLAEKHKVLLQIDPDYKGLPAQEQVKALDAIHYGSLGQISGTGDMTGAGTAALGVLKKAPGALLETAKMAAMPWNTSRVISDVSQTLGEAIPEYQRARTAGADPLSAGISAGVVGAGSRFGVSEQRESEQAKQGESGQILGEAAVPAGMAALPLVTGEIKFPGRTAAARTGTASPVAHSVAGAVGRTIGHATGIPGAGAVGEFLGRRIAGRGGLPGSIEPPPIPETAESFSKQQRSAAYEEMNKDFAKKTAAKAKADAAAAKAQVAVDKAAAKAAAKVPPNPFPGASTSGTPSMTSPVGQTQLSPEPVPVKPVSPSPFSGMTSTAPGSVAGGAELPPVPQGQPTPFPTVTRKGGISAPPTVEAPQTGGPLDVPSGKTSILSRAKTPIEIGVEPDMNNPAHVKMINDIIGQGLNEAAINKLKVRAKLGDRFAAVALDYWRSKTGR